MKLLYFLIVIAIIYFIASKINVVHVNSLSDNHKNVLDTRSKIRSMLMSNNLVEDPNESKEGFTQAELSEKYSSRQFDSRNYKRDYYDFTDDNDSLPSPNELVTLIKSEYTDVDYRFNAPNLPVTSRYPDSNNIMDKKYVKHISKDISRWNNLFKKYYSVDEKLIVVNRVNLVFIKETESEFFVVVNAKISYINRSFYCELTYYGQIEKNDDFINGASDKFLLQLVSFKPIDKSNFNTDVLPIDDQGPFMTMKEQLEYVDRVNKIHQDENDQE